MNNRQLISQFKLPSYVAGKSFADASKAIAGKFEGRNDMASNKTKAELLKRLADAQEYLKAQQEAAMQQQQPIENPMAMGGYTNQYVEGGLFNSQINKFDPNAGVGYKFGNNSPNSISSIENADAGGEEGPSAGSIVGAAGTALELGNLAFGKPAQDTSGVAESADINGAQMIGGSTLKGAAAGTAIAPGIGTAIGAGVGAIAGILGNKKAKKAALENTINFANKTNQQFSDKFALGGNITTPIVNPSIAPTNNMVNNVANVTGVGTTPINDNLAFNTKSIVKYQPGVTHGKTGESGFYIYSKDPSQGGFDVNRDREFIKQSNMLALQKTPQWKVYMASQTNQHDGGGPMEPKQNTYSLKNDNSLFVNNFGMNPEDIKSIPNFKKMGYIDYKQGDANLDGVINKNDTPKSKFSITVSDTGKFIGDNYQNLLRYAPALTNAIQLAKLKKPEGVITNKLSNRYKPTYTDLAQQQNIANQELNAVNSAIQQSGASQGASRAALLASQLNKTRALSNVYAQAQQQNAQQDAIAQQFNLGVDQTNLQQSNLEEDINARNKGAYENEKSKLIFQLGTDIGNIGKEQLFKQYPKMMGLGYNWNGKYFVNDKGDIKTKEEAKALEGNKKADGGYLNKQVLNHINNMYLKRNKK